MIITWQTMLGQIKDEAKVKDITEDANILAIANEVLNEIGSLTEDLRSLRLDFVFAVTGPISTEFIGVNISKLDQVLCQRFVTGAMTHEWDMTEYGGIVYPSGYPGYPNSYTLTQIPNVADETIPRYKMFFYGALPASAFGVNDKIHLIGTGFENIVDINSFLPYESFYPMLKRSILQRLQIKRNTNPDMVQAWEDQIKRGQAAASVGDKDNANHLAQENTK